MQPLVPNVLDWTRFSEPHGYDFHGTLLELEDGNVCIDPVEPSATDLEELAERGVARIVLTNRNHVRAANRIRAVTGARTVMHAADAEHARRQGAVLDGEIAQGARIGPLTIVSVAGKSPGEVAIHWAERRLLVVGDAVIGNPPGRLSLLPEAKLDDPRSLRASVRRLVDLDLDVLVVGDGVPILAGARAALERLAAGFPD
ncbi:MAG: MBL fold metallo-hydrolase [Candidatus Binatia bacterium]